MPREKILIYGFGPFGGYDNNVSEAVVRMLRPGRHVVTEVFPTRFSRAMFLLAMKKHAPDIIIGLGQHRLARKAVNLRGRRGERPRSIAASGPADLPATLRLPRTVETTLAYDAGTYVCNFSMYVLSDWCNRHGCRFAFVHIPRRYPPARAAAYLRLYAEARVI